MSRTPINRYYTSPCLQRYVAPMAKSAALLGFLADDELPDFHLGWPGKFGRSTVVGGAT